MQDALKQDTSGHDWQHITRVVEIALNLSEGTDADRLTVHLAALLHDVADPKLNSSKEAGMKRVGLWFQGQNLDHAVADHVREIIGTMSFAGGQSPPMRTLEGQIVQDADRLDAMGAIGIARAFMYAGAQGRVMYREDAPIQTYQDEAHYRRGSASTIHHFYEKLLKLKAHMNTEAGKRLAEQRHRFLLTYLDQFYVEWPEAQPKDKQAW